jgi:hypothetical protein
MTTIKSKHGRTATGGISLVALLILTLSMTKVVEANYLYPEKNGNDIICLFSNTKPDVPADQDEASFILRHYVTVAPSISAHSLILLKNVVSLRLVSLPQQLP